MFYFFLLIRMNKFIVGVVAGMSSLAMAVPLVAQLARAQSSEASAMADRPAPTQECLQAMVTLDDAHLANFDAESAERKSKMQEKRDALAAVAALTDETARTAALKTLHEDMRSNPKDHMQPEAVTKAMEALKAACGDSFHFGKGGPGMMHRGGPFQFGKGHGPMKEVLSEKLGMTAEELKAALESGKSIEQIAEEKGIDLPSPPRHRGGPFGESDEDNEQSD